MRTCYLCNQAIKPGDAVNLHHPVYSSEGGIETEPTHAACHVRFHSRRGDFKAWGKVGGQLTALTRRWSLNLKNVKDDPSYAFDRAYYFAQYAH